MRFPKRVREHAFARAGYKCEIRGPGCLFDKRLELHHRISNTEANRSIYGPVLQSSRNACVACYNCHRHYQDTVSFLRDDAVVVA